MTDHPIPEWLDWPPEQIEGGEAAGEGAIAPNRDQIEKFVRAVFKYATPGNWISLRIFRHDNGPPFRIRAGKFTGDFEPVIEAAYRNAVLAANNREKLVFCPPLVTFTSGERAREQDVAEGLLLSVECDEHAEATRTALEGLLGPATIVVMSGGEWLNPETGEVEPKLHLHWRLKLPTRTSAEHKKLKEARKLATKIGGADTSNPPLVHPIRWPGSVHRKGEPKLCRIIALNDDAEIDLNTALERLQAEVSSEPQAKTKARPEQVTSSDWSELLGLVLSSDNYHEPLLRLAAKVITSGMDGGTAVNLLRALMENSDGPRDERWKARYDDIPRAVSTAQEKFGPHAGQNPLIVDLGSKLWGPATPHGKEYRFGADQSKAVDPGKNTWFDFATNQGGNLKELMKKVEAADNRGQSNVDDIVIINAADVKMRPLDWIWPGHLLRGSQELLSGLPDLGKSQVQIGYVACATAGLPWPDGAKAIEPMNVIMMTAEDTLDQLVVPRLKAAGADLKRVHFLKCIKTDKQDRQFFLAEDLHRLENLVRKIGNVGLICIDPITAYMGGSMDSHKATEVRSQLGPLKDFAERLNIAISTITHPPKAAGQRALDHFIGSQAFVAACRIGHLCIAEMEENEDGERVPTGRILFATVRNTAMPKKPTLAFRKEAVEVGREGEGLESVAITAPRVVWEGVVDITADAALNAVSGKKSDMQPKVQAFLFEMLKDSKPVPQREIEEAAAKLGFTSKQLRYASKKLGVRTFKARGAMGGGWLWQLGGWADPDTVFEDHAGGGSVLD